MNRPARAARVLVAGYKPNTVITVFTLVIPHPVEI